VVLAVGVQILRVFVVAHEHRQRADQVHAILEDVEPRLHLDPAELVLHLDLRPQVLAHPLPAGDTRVEPALHRQARLVVLLCDRPADAGLRERRRVDDVQPGRRVTGADAVDDLLRL
jgi:hypothetical protein